MSTFSLKILAIIFMLMDHMYRLLPGYPLWFSYVGRLAAPIFFFLIVEGFIHTSNRKKYMMRLFGFGILMIGVDYFIGINYNIFLSLGGAVALLTALDYAKQKKYAVQYILLAVGIAVFMFFTEASYYGIGLALIFYYLHDKKGWMLLAYAALSLIPSLLYVRPGMLRMDLLVYHYQWMMVFAYPFFLLYNAKKGYNSTIAKWAFYLFYPVHLIVLRLIALY